MEYQCTDCGMEVKGLACGKCGSELQPKTVKNAQGKNVQVSECPNSCGKIKSPVCCSHDMQARA